MDVLGTSALRPVHHAARRAGAVQASDVAAHVPTVTVHDPVSWALRVMA
ncbi:hypothetical protein [Saccharothrix yanglingensis]|nr:hypothetical protein [Saccharothrix yanglingensis]